MFPDLEVTFMAALLLALSSIVFPRAIDPLFLCTARDVLQDMKLSGNIPADALLKELNEISDLITNFSATQVASLSPQLGAPVRMTYDGNVLNDELADIVKTDLLQTWSSNVELSHPQRPSTNVAGEHDYIIREEHEPPQPVVDSSLTLAPSEVENSVPQPDGIFLDYFDASAIQFDSEITNSDWLDFV